MPSKEETIWTLAGLAVIPTRKTQNYLVWTHTFPKYLDANLIEYLKQNIRRIGSEKDFKQTSTISTPLLVLPRIHPPLNMACVPANPDALVDLVEVPPPFWETTDENPHGLELYTDPDHDDHCDYTRCAICGLQITDKSATNGGWTSETLMIGDLSREYEHVQTNRKYPMGCEDPAVFSACIANDCSPVKGCGYSLGRDRSCTFFPYAADVCSCNGGPDGKNIVYLPTHRACFNIALQSPRWGDTSSSRLRGLFRVLRHRFQVTWEQCLRRYSEDHENEQISLGYVYIKMSGFQNTQGIERGYFSKRCLGTDFWKDDHYLLYDPLKISSLTDTLLKNLELRTTSGDTEQLSSFEKRFRRLPNELKILTYEYLVQDQEWPLKCTRLLSPRFWKAQFNRGNPYMEWLWDLDFELVRRTDPDLQMDWELLFRQLSQGPKIADCFGDHADSDYEIFRGVLACVPPGLEGRRRIWRLVEEMRMGDRSAYWELTSCFPWHEASVTFDSDRNIAEVPVYWGGDGESLDEEELRAL